jgi:hypothetical protein
MKIQNGNPISYYKSILKEIVLNTVYLYIHFDEVKLKIKDYIQNGWDELVGKKGPKYAGYRKGYIIFEILITVLTDGGTYWKFCSKKV